jgi:hypothetical protein
MSPFMNSFGAGSTRGFGRNFRGPSSLYQFTSHQFTNAGVVGANGPTLAQCRTAYTSASWTQNNSFFNMTTQGIQLWTVPETGLYSIQIAGAAAGTGNNSNFGFGAYMAGTFSLEVGTILKIMVGQRGTNNPDTAQAGAGGGGTFVSSNLNVPLIVAGGGGGYRAIGIERQNAKTSTGNGNGGQNINGTYSGAGGGFNTNGSGTGAGAAFINNGVGGSASGKVLPGGFGGGGAANTGNADGGGGGGYQGGNSGDRTAGNYNAEGGYSYNIGVNQLNSVGNSGHGYVTITKL